MAQHNQSFQPTWHLIPVQKQLRPIFAKPIYKIAFWSKLSYHISFVKTLWIDRESHVIFYDFSSFIRSIITYMRVDVFLHLTLFCWYLSWFLWFQECQSLECSNTELRFQIRTLEGERDELRRLWNAHVQQHRCVPNTSIKPRLISPVTMGMDVVNAAKVVGSTPSILTQPAMVDQ